MPDRKYHPKSSGSEVLFGIHSLQEAIRAGRRKIYKIYILNKRTPNRFREIIQHAESYRIPIQWLDRDAFGALVGQERHQGIGARVSPYPLVDFSKMLNRFETDHPTPFLLLLDGIVDPQNFGALVRTADCVGVDGICIPKDRSSRPTPAVSRASAGALEHAAVARITNMVSTMSLLKKKGFWIVGLDAAENNAIFSADLTVPLAIVIGGEQKGIRPLVKKQCDLLVSIPQSGKIDALNASVAGAVAMYEVYRQRICRVQGVK
jgi:23S rRNA (guanosine2251-2'-O)-methyltransferase